MLLSSSLSTFLPLARRQVEAVRETGTPVVVGGSAFDSEGRRARVIGATAFATSARTSVNADLPLPWLPMTATRPGFNVIRLLNQDSSRVEPSCFRISMPRMM